ncbi:MAG: glucose-6-phosphate isomerase, partial [Endomicrobiaceae bacterium]|nr:glucose-6-phosphate isomerase [Endomicrobiaceae bacterium]
MSSMKAMRDAGTLTISEIKKFEAVIVKSMVTTFALDALAEVYSKEFMDIAFGEANNAVSANDKIKYIENFSKGDYVPFSVITTAVGWKNIADGQKAVEKEGKRFLIGVESSGGISIGLYDKDGAPATMMPVLFAAKSGETLEQKLAQVEKKIGLKVHSIETAVKFPVEVEAEIEKVTKDIMDVKIDENEVDEADSSNITVKKSITAKKTAKVVEMAKKELTESDEWYETASIPDIVKKMAGSRQKAMLDWIEASDIQEIEELLYSLGMPKNLKVVEIEKLPKEGIQIRIAGAEYTKGDGIRTLLTFRASGTEPLIRVYAYTTDGKLTTQLKDIGESIVKGAFKKQGVLKSESTVSTTVTEGLKNALNPIPSIIAAAINLLSGESRAVLAKAVKRIYEMSEKDREGVIKSVSEKYPGFELRFVGNASRPESLELKIGVFYSLHFDGVLYKNANEPDTVAVSANESVPEAVKSILSEILKYGTELTQAEKIEQAIKKLGVSSEEEARYIEIINEIASLESQYGEQLSIFENLEGKELKTLLDSFADVETHARGLSGYFRDFMKEATSKKDPMEGKEILPSEDVKGVTEDVKSVTDERYAELERKGVPEIKKLGIVLVAGGMGERLGYLGIKIGLKFSALFNKTYIGSYITYLDGLAEESYRQDKKKVEIPFTIMTSDSTNDKTIALLNAMGYGVQTVNPVNGLVTLTRADGKDSGVTTIYIIKQKNVPAIKDGKFSIINGKLETKPHGHGDVHQKMHSSGVAEIYRQQDKSRTLFIQDTNGSGLNFILPMLGTAVGKKMVIATVKREDGEKVGGIVGVSKKGVRNLENIEYNILGNRPGYNSGNINQYILDTDEYCDILGRTNGIVPEMTNVKPGKSSRLESLMQTIYEFFNLADSMILNFEDKPFGFSPAKNGIVEITDIKTAKLDKDIEEALAEGDKATADNLQKQKDKIAFIKSNEGQIIDGIKVVEYNGEIIYVLDSTQERVRFAVFAKKISDSMITAEQDNYENFIKILKEAGVEIADSFETIDVAGMSVKVKIPVFLDDYGSVNKFKNRVKGKNSVSARSSVYLSGNAGLNGVSIDGAVRVSAANGVSVTLKGDINNAGYKAEPLSKAEILAILKDRMDRKAKGEVFDESADEDLQAAVRGYRYVKGGELEINITQPGQYEVNIENGIVTVYKVEGRKKTAVAQKNTASGIIEINASLFEDMAKAVGGVITRTVPVAAVGDESTSLLPEGLKELTDGNILLPELAEVVASIEEAAGAKYPELMEQTKKDIARMIETDAFLTDNEKNLPAQEKAKLVQERITKALSQLDRYLRGDLEGLIPVSSKKSVEFGTAGNRAKIFDDDETKPNFDFNNVALIAQAMANIINADPSLPKAVFVGNDTRFLGKWFSIVMERILTANGIQVYTAKEKIATPTIACYVKEVMPGKFAATLNVTASHNPKEYNGVKPNSGDGAPALPEFTQKITEEIKRIQDSAEGKAVKIADKENSIFVTDADIKHFEYVRDRLNALIGVKEGETIESFRQRAARIGIVLDGKNTALMPVLKSLLEYYGFKNVIIINENRDVAFGGKVNPEPNDKNTIELSDMVKEGKLLFAEKGMEVDFSFGISTDPDGDRFCVKDVSGMHMTPDEVGTIDAYELLENMMSSMKAMRDAGTLTISEIKKFEAVIVKSMVTTFALDALAEVYSREFMDIAFGYSNKAVDDRARVYYRSAFAKGEYTPFSVRTTAVGWKNIADGQKAVEKEGKRFLIGVESSGGISIGLYDKDGAPATMMPVLFATKSGETLEEKLAQVEKKIGLKVHSIETSVKFPVEVEAEIEKVTKDIMDVEVIENEVDEADSSNLTVKKLITSKKLSKIIEIAKQELINTEELDLSKPQKKIIETIVNKIAAKRQKEMLNWIESADKKEIENLLYALGMPKDLKIIEIEKLYNDKGIEGIQIRIAGAGYKEGDDIRTFLTFRASGTEPLIRVYAYTTDGKLTPQLSNIGESIVKGAFKTISPVLTDTQEYKKAQRSARRDKTTIKDKFASDSSKPKGQKRGDLFQKRIDLGNGSSLTFDFSRSVMTDKLMKMFADLFTARKIKEKIEAMFKGDKINWTEQRAVLHTALRNTSDKPVFVDGKDVMPKVREVLQKMKDFSNKIITGQWKGSTGKQITDIVSIGIGGSDLGPRMGAEALAQFRAEGSPRVHFVSNVDPNDINSILNSLGLNPETTLFIIESKTFTTEETITNATIAKQWVTDKLGTSPDVIKKHFVAVSTNKEKVAEFGIDTDNMFEFWDWVGGRYSVWSAVGLPLMCSIGYDNFMEFLDGAHEMDVHFRDTPYEQNIPMIMAMLNIANSNFLGRKAYAILPYNRYLKLFTAHIQQVYMESLGKSVDSQGRRIKYQTGSEVYGTAGTDAQHSYLQEHHQGTDIIPVDFIGFAKTRLTDPAMQKSHKRLLANMLAQSDAMAFGRTYEETVEKLVAEGMDRTQAERTAKDQTFDGNRPSSILMFDELNPRTLGALTALYENMVATLGAVWDVNAFDQMGVELGKKNAKSTFKALEDGVTDALNSSTANFVNMILGKLEIAGVWGSVKNSWWVKILARIMNPQNTFEGQMRVRNLAVAIKEFPRTLNLEKFIQAHDQPENVRQHATGLLKVTQKSFSQSALIAWKGALFGALGIVLTAATGGLFLIGTIAITSVLFLTPFITASVTNIKWHYNYNNKVDEDETYLIEIGLLNNAQARNYVRERLLSDPSITEGMTENEKINYYAYVKIADKTDLAYMFLNNPALFKDVTDLLGNKVDKLIIDIEEYVFRGTGLEDLSLSAYLKFVQNDKAIMRKFEALKAWLMINVGLDAAAIKILFDNPEGTSVIKSLADKKQVERAVKLLSNPNDYETQRRLKSLNRQAYVISRMFKNYPALLDTAENASYDYDTTLDAILQVINRIEKSKLEMSDTKPADVKALEEAIEEYDKSAKGKEDNLRLQEAMSKVAVVST